MTVNLTIDGKSVSVQDGTTILEAGREAGASIPTICFHEATTSNSLCRICVVEVEGQRVLQPACTFQALDGMKIQTMSARVIRARKTLLEMLAASIDLTEAPEIQEMLKEYQANSDRFPDSVKRSSSVLDDNPMYIRDYSKCILCWRCVQVCADDAQYIYAINFKERGFATQISTFYETDMTNSTCVFCGQCIGVCPTGALKSKREFLLEKGFSQEQISVLPSKPRRREKR